MRNYIPVSCALYDEFEAAATKKQDCEIVYLEQEEEKLVKTKIIDFKNYDKFEFMVLQDGTKVRLDRVLSFNGSDTRSLNHY